MRRNLFSIIAGFMVAVVCLPFNAFSSDTAMFNYQGQVQVQDQSFNGSGNFKFAILSPDGSATLWSNDSTSIDASEPTTAVPIEVIDGIFNINVGIPSLMDRINSSIFQTRGALKLRIWFSDGVHGFQALSPDHELINLSLIMSETGSSDFTIYVDQATGDDTNSGLSITQPKETIQAAIDIVPARVRANVTIKVAEGVYPESLVMYGINVRPGKFLTIEGDSDWTTTATGSPKVILSGSDEISTTTANETLLLAEQCTGLKLKGLCFENSKASGVQLENGKYRIENCLLKNNVSSGVYLLNQAKLTGSGIIAKDNGLNGLALNDQSRAHLERVVFTGNGNMGVFMTDSSTINFDGTGVFSNNQSNGLHIIGNSQVGFSVSFTGEIRSNKGYGIVAGWNSYSHYVTSNISIQGNQQGSFYEFHNGHTNW